MFANIHSHGIFINKYFENMYLINYCSDLKSVSRCKFGINEEHLKPKNKFSILWGKDRIFDKQIQFLEFLKTSIISLGYTGFQKGKVFFCFCFFIKLIPETRIKVKEHPLSLPTLIL